MTKKKVSKEELIAAYAKIGEYFETILSITGHPCLMLVRVSKDGHYTLEGVGKTVEQLDLVTKTEPPDYFG